MLDLLGVVDLQEVVAPKLHVRQLLVVFEEVNGEVHLGGAARGWRERAATEWHIKQRAKLGEQLWLLWEACPEIQTSPLPRSNLCHATILVYNITSFSPGPSFLITLTAIPILSFGL